MKTLQNHFVRSALFLLFALLFPLLGWGQGMPKLNRKDFTLTVVSGNTTCDTPGGVIITYRNAVAGIQKLRYEFPKGWGYEPMFTQEVAPNVAIYQALPDWDMNIIRPRVTGLGAGNEQTNTVTIAKQIADSESEEGPQSQYRYTESTIADADIFTSTDPADGCDGTRGRITMALIMSGFTNVEWKLYRGATLLNTINSTTPNLPASFENLSAGVYRLEARATPICANSHPALTAPGASWDGNTLVFTRDISIGAFQINQEEISGVIGNCNSTYRAQLSGVFGVTSITAEVLPKGGATVLKTTTTDASKDFKISFEELPIGDYTLRLTAANCSAVMQKDFSIKNTEPNVQARFDFNAVLKNMCAKHTVFCSTNIPYPERPQTYRLIHVASGDIVGTKTWQYSEADPECRITDLTLKNQEDYVVEADFCGITKRSQVFKVYLYGANLQWSVLSNATGICTGQGGKAKVMVRDAQARPMALAGTLELINANGESIMSQSMPDGWNGEAVFDDIPPSPSYLYGGANEYYKVRFTLDCNGTSSEYNFGSMYMNAASLSIEVKPIAWVDQCVAKYALDFKPDGTEIEKILTATFKVQKSDGTIVWQGVYVPDFDNGGFMRVTLPSAGQYAVMVRPSCGTSVAKSRGVDIGEIKKEDAFKNAGEVIISKKSYPCHGIGEVDLSSIAPAAYPGVWEIEKDGAPYLTGKFGYPVTGLPVGHYKITAHLECDPTIKIERTFEMISGLEVSRFETYGSCGSKVLGTTYISVSILKGQRINYSYKIYNSDTETLVEEKNLTRGDYSSNDWLYYLRTNLPSGNYRLEFKPETFLCGGGFPAYTYNFTVPNNIGNTLFLASEPQKDNNAIIPIKVTHTPYLSSVGSVTAGVYKLRYELNYNVATSAFPILITLRSVNSSFSKTLTAYGLGKNVKFENLPPGTYRVSATIDGNSCIPEQEVKIETIQSDAWSASAHLSPRCKKRAPHVSFRVAGNHPSLATTVYTFKAYVWDDAASNYVIANSVTGTPGQLTAMVDVTEYTGSTAPAYTNRYGQKLYMPYKYTIETNGKEVYSTLDCALNYVDGSSVMEVQKTDATFAQGVGSVTVKLKKQYPYDPNESSSPILPSPGSLLDELTWTCRSNDGVVSIEKKADFFSPVVFDNLPPGQYSLTCTKESAGCGKMATNYNANFQIVAPGLHIQATGVDGKCLSDCQIKVKVLDDATAFSKITYKIEYIQEGVPRDQVISKNDATQEVIFNGLPEGNYKLTATAERMTSDGLKLYPANATIALKTASPDMNIIQDAGLSRPAYNNCPTGYLAFRFQSDNNSYGGISRTFSDDYQFTITEAPAGVTTPLTFKLSHFATLYPGFVAITPFRNLPAGTYKVKVENSCKTLMLTCNIPQQNMVINGTTFSFCPLNNNYLYYSNHLGLNIYTKNGKYYFTSSPLYNPLEMLQIYNAKQFLWDDLLTIDYHDRLGSEMKNIPYDGEERELTIRPWAMDKVTFKFNCANLPTKVLTGGASVCEETRTYCGLPNINVNILLNKINLPEKFTLVVNEMVGTSIGTEVLRQENPNTTYSLGNSRKTFLARLYTADNILFYQIKITPIGAPNVTMLLSSSSSTNCVASKIAARFSEDVIPCYAPYVLKTYTTDGTRTLVREELLQYLSTPRYEEFPWNYSPNTNYEFELYSADGTLLDRKAVHTPPFTNVSLPATFFFGNTCDGNYTNTAVTSFTQNGKMVRKMFYRLKYIYWRQVPPPTPPNAYYGGHNGVLTVIKDGVKYKANFYLNISIGVSPATFYTKLDWVVERNGTTYPSLGPIYDWGETINGTLSVPECGLSVPVTGKAERKELQFYNSGLENMTKVQTCTGWDIVPGGQVSYVGVDNNRHIVTYKEYSLNRSQWKDVNVPFAMPKASNGMTIYLRGDDMCDIEVGIPKQIYKPHEVNQLESASYYCSDDNMGRIYVGAKDGVPPYKYVLLSGESESSPEVETKTSSGSVVFKYGDVGKKYRVHVFDACGSLRIHYITSVVSTVDLGYNLSRTQKLCAGDNLQLTTQSFPGSAYDWTLPDGTHRNTRILDLGSATRAMAGSYHVAITPPDCNSTINATITVVVDDIGAPTWTPAVQTICQGTTATLSPGAAQSYTDNTPGTPKYQWQKQDSNGTNFSDIAGATLADYAFQADNPGTYTFRRVTTYKGCEHTSDEAKVVVTPGPIQTLSPAELERTVRKGSTGYTLTGGSLQTNGTTIASYKWERSTDGSTWTTVGTTANYKETQKFKLEKVYYRRTVTPTVGTCVHTTPTITVNFKKMRTAYVNPHIRTRVKSE